MSKNLRSQAERRLRSEELELEEMSDKDVRELAHELRVHQIELEMQNDELKRAQEVIEQSRQKYSDLYDFAPSGYLTLDENGIILESNLTFTAHLGLDRTYILGKPLSAFITSPITTLYRHLSLVLKERRKASVELRLKKKDGEELPVILESVPVEDEGRPVSCRTSVTDIRQRIQAEEALRRAHDELEIRVRERTAELSSYLDEKDILIREIHHRVKNNMQVISSLLRLQADRSKDKAYAKMLTESQERIKSMALIHEQLYQSRDFVKIDFRDYVDSLVKRLFHSYGANVNQIKAKIVVEDVNLNIEDAIPCGLIINELISNAVKYAFPEGRKGELRIAFCKAEKYDFELTVADNGIGLPKELDMKNVHTLGLYLVTMLGSNQLDGEVKLNRKDGTEFIIRFNKQASQARR